MDGVLATRAGWIGKIEVTEVTFDPRRVSFRQLLEQGTTHNCGSHVFPLNDRQREIASEFEGVRDAGRPGPIRLEGLKYHLGRTPGKHVPLAPWQAVRWNAALGKRKPWKAEEWLSPTQLRFWRSVQRTPKADWPVAIGKALPAAWTEAVRVARSLPR